MSKRLLKITSVLVVLTVIFLIVYPQLPSGAQTVIKNFPGKSASYVKGTIAGTYADTTKTLPALPDSLKKVDTLLVAYKSQYRMQLYYSGKLIKTYIIGLGQEPLGHKQEQGDNRTPEGNYKIIEKAVGPFGGANPYLGNRWMRLNYPNNADAKAGLDKKFITEDEYDKIVAANKKGKEPPKTTRLGGGIGIHGWHGAWPGDDEQDLTWGCITMQNEEVEDLYDRIRVGTRVVIYP